MNEENLLKIKHLLPDNVLQIIQIIGIDAAFELVRKYGGTVFPIGKNATKHGKVLHAALAEVVGEEKAQRLSLAFATQRGIYIPKCQKALLEMRDKQIRQDFDSLTMYQNPKMPAYLAVRNLALQYNLSERHVWHLLKHIDEAEQNDVQTLLFG